MSRAVLLLTVSATLAACGPEFAASSKGLTYRPPTCIDRATVYCRFSPTGEILRPGAQYQLSREQAIAVAKSTRNAKGIVNTQSAWSAIVRFYCDDPSTAHDVEIVVNNTPNKPWIRDTSGLFEIDGSEMLKVLESAGIARAHLYPTWE